MIDLDMYTYTDVFLYMDYQRIADDQYHFEVHLRYLIPQL